MTRFSLTAFILMCVITATVSVLYATTYRYIDANGATCYADGLSNVPPAYQSRVVIVLKSDVPHQVRFKTVKPAIAAVTSHQTAPVQDQQRSFRINWGFLLVVLTAGFIAAGRIQRQGKIARAGQLRLATVLLTVAMAVLLNQDLANRIVTSLRQKQTDISETLREQEEKDKKPLKTLSEKVDEMMQQAEK